MVVSMVATSTARDLTMGFTMPFGVSLISARNARVKTVSAWGVLSRYWSPGACRPATLELCIGTGHHLIDDQSQWYRPSPPIAALCEIHGAF